MADNPFELNLIWLGYRAALKFGIANPITIREELGLSDSEYSEYLNTQPAFQRAIEQGNADRLPAVYQDLSEEAKEIWRTLTDREAVADAKQAALLAVANGGRREQQKLLIYALAESHFDVYGTLKTLKIPQKVFNTWVKEDPEFQELLNEIQANKRAFVEGKLFKLIAMGSERATIFGAERLLKEYSAKMEVSGTVNHQHNTGLDLSVLPVELRSKIFALLSESGVIDPDGLLAESIDAKEVKRLN